MKAIKLFIVDDHPLVIEGLKNMLSTEKGLLVLGSATDGQSALAFLKNNETDIAFLDINLPDMSGIDLCKKIKQDHPSVKCLALSTFNERSYVSKMIQSGALGYLLKNSSREEILEAIKQVSSGGMYLKIPLTEANTTASVGKIPFLTKREKEVLLLIADGETNNQIAEKLFVSVTTINSHRKNLLMKFEVNNTASLIKLATQHQLI